MIGENSVKVFFEAMSERLSKENNLSDITYALCRSNDDFKKRFLEYCFEELPEIIDIRRECSKDDSRPDFVFEDEEGKEYVVEVKINDTNQHFSQYEKVFPNAKYAFISNYDLSEPKFEVKNKKDRDALSKWKVKTWKGFYEALSKSGLKEDVLVSGYLAYLKNIIDIKEFKAMDISKVQYLPTFYNDLRKIAEEKGFEEYRRSVSCTNYYYGSFFAKDDFYLWLGLSLGDGKVWLGLKNDENWITTKIQKN